MASFNGDHGTFDLFPGKSKISYHGGKKFIVSTTEYRDRVHLPIPFALEMVKALKNLMETKNHLDMQNVMESFYIRDDDLTIYLSLMKIGKYHMISLNRREEKHLLSIPIADNICEEQFSYFINRCIKNSCN